MSFRIQHGRKLLHRYEQLAITWRERIQQTDGWVLPGSILTPQSRMQPSFWARTIICPYCGGVVPLSPNWRLNTKGTGVRFVPHIEDPEQSALYVRSRHQGKGPQPRHGEAGGRPLPLSRLRPGDRRRRGQVSGPGWPRWASSSTPSSTSRRQDGYHQSGQGQAQDRSGDSGPPDPRTTSLARVEAALEAKRDEWQARNIYPSEQIRRITIAVTC